MLVVNHSLYPGGILPSHESGQDFYARFCVWADSNGFNTPEFLLPQIIRKTKIAPFRFEQRFGETEPPSREEIDSIGPWDYQIEWSGTMSNNIRHEGDWPFHRYRSSLLVDLASDIAGPTKADMSVLDVGCHCGIFALEFGEAGFGRVKGLDLRQSNIQQANLLKKTFHCPNVSFEVANARDLKGRAADVVFCAGLFHHVTYPVELVTELFNATRKFLIFDSLCQNHAFSGFHVVDGKDMQLTLEGDNPIALMPTYRAIIDLLRAAGFAEIYEILGDQAVSIQVYKARNIRSFIAVKPGFEIPRHVTESNGRQLTDRPDRLKSRVSMPLDEATEKTSDEASNYRATVIKDPFGRVWKPVSHARELLALDDEEFVYRAYVTLFNRLPEAGGLNNYLLELKSGVTKLEIISRLRKSEEGRQSAVHLIGYGSAVLESRLPLFLARGLPGLSKRWEREADDREFQTSVVDKIEGWLERITSLRTMDILSWQEEKQIGGPLLEIGVFAGKYFSLLARSAQRSGSKLLGIETFLLHTSRAIFADFLMPPPKVLDTDIGVA